MSSTDLQQFLAFLEVGPEGISDLFKNELFSETNGYTKNNPTSVPTAPILKSKLLDEVLIAIAANVFEDTNLSSNKSSQSATKRLPCMCHPWCNIHSLHQSMTLPRSRIDAIKLARHATIILQTDIHLGILEVFLGIGMLVLRGEKR